jgi:dTDP-glucose 4,6-dehydratase
MRILCTGAFGFIGSHFVEAAEAAGHQVAIIDNLNYAGRSRNLPFHRAPRTDICDLFLVRQRFADFRPDAVVHLAAESHVARSIECREEFLRTNVVGTNALLEATLEYWRADDDCHPAFRFLHVSTDEVYGSLGPNDAPWTEASPYAPNNPYAASKAASDHLVRSYRRTFGLPTIITHSSNNYGPRQHPEKLIPTLIGQCMRGEPMTLHGDGTNVRDWLHVEDHCAGLLAALRRGVPGETYNFGGECERPNLAIARLVGAYFGITLDRVALVGDRAGNDRRYSSDCLKAWNELGWRPGPKIDDRTHLERTIRWYIDNPNYALEYGH